MALIVKCRACLARMPQDQRSCPACGHALFKFTVDFWPDGRHGKRVYFTLPATVTNLADAREFEKNIRAAARADRSDPKPNIGTTFNELNDEYLTWVRLHRTKATCREREYTLKHILERIGTVPVASFGGRHVSAYQMTRLGQGISNKTVNKELYYVMAFIRWCREEKGMAVTPPAMKKLAYHRPVPVVLSPDEARRIIEVCTPFYKAFLLCLYSLGLRLSEAQGLTWDNVDFANRAVLVRQKGGSMKVLPLNEWLEDALAALPRQPGQSIFLSPRTGRPIVNVRKALAAAVKRAGIQKRVYPHLFRHSIATTMMSEDVNLRKVQAYLGHADVKTTEWYTHVVASHLRAATEGMFRRLSTQKGK